MNNGFRNWFYVTTTIWSKRKTGNRNLCTFSATAIQCWSEQLQSGSKHCKECMCWKYKVKLNSLLYPQLLKHVYNFLFSVPSAESPLELVYSMEENSISLTKKQDQYVLTVLKGC